MFSHKRVWSCGDSSPTIHLLALLHTNWDCLEFTHQGGEHKETDVDASSVLLTLLAAQISLYSLDAYDLCPQVISNWWLRKLSTCFGALSMIVSKDVYLARLKFFNKRIGVKACQWGLKSEMPKQVQTHQWPYVEPTSLKFAHRLYVHCLLSIYIHDLQTETFRQQFCVHQWTAYTTWQPIRQWYETLQAHWSKRQRHLGLPETTQGGRVALRNLKYRRAIPARWQRRIRCRTRAIGRVPSAIDRRSTLHGNARSRWVCSEWFGHRPSTRTENQGRSTVGDWPVFHVLGEDEEGNGRKWRPNFVACQPASVQQVAKRLLNNTEI